MLSVNDFFCLPPFRREARGHSIRHSVLPSVRPSVLYMQLLLQLYADSFKTLQTFRSWSEYKVNRYWVAMQLLLPFYADSFETVQVFRSCFENVHIVEYNPHFIFCHFLHKMNLVIFSANRYWVSCVCNSSYSFLRFLLNIKGV